MAHKDGRRRGIKPVTNVIDLCREILEEAGFSTTPISSISTPSIAFESDTVLGFALSYENVPQLLARWREDVDGLFRTNRLALRRANEKAWNAYGVLLSGEPDDGDLAVRLELIEEDLVGYRKIAFAGIADAIDMRNALLPLLPLQSAPKLDAVDMPNEIWLRTKELRKPIVDGFLSRVDRATMLQLLEEGDEARLS